MYVVGFIIRICHDAQSRERQITEHSQYCNLKGADYETHTRCSFSQLDMKLKPPINALPQLLSITSLQFLWSWCQNTGRYLEFLFKWLRLCVEFTLWISLSFIRVMVLSRGSLCWHYKVERNKSHARECRCISSAQICLVVPCSI